MNPKPLCTALALVLGLFAPQGGIADSPPPFAEFTFKMGKPPKPGTSKRITVQIEPGAQPAAQPAAAMTAATHPGEFHSSSRLA